MNARLFNPENYPIVEGWWKAHGVPAVGASALPPLGVIVEDESGPLAVCWLYLALGVGVAWLAWLTTNPEQSPLKAAKAVKYLIQAAEAALPIEYDLLAAMPQQESYKRLLQKEGYTTAHTCTEMFKSIKR